MSKRLTTSKPCSRRGKRIQRGISMYESEWELMYLMGFMSVSKGFRSMMDHLETNAEFLKFVEDNKWIDKSNYFLNLNIEEK